MKDKENGQLNDSEFWALRKCMLETIPAHDDAYTMLSAAIVTDRRGKTNLCGELLEAADIPDLAVWADRLWGKTTKEVHRLRQVPAPLPVLSKELREKNRMPNAAEKARIIARDGKNCGFCGARGFFVDVRNSLVKKYPNQARWGRSNDDCHAGLLTLWLTFDHIVPHSRGGTNDIDNIIVACQPCNGARNSWTLDEVGLRDPRIRR